MTMAGKAAEVMKYGAEHVSNGPAGDIQQASALARAMVLRWGMSDKVGNIDYAEAHEGYSGQTPGFSVSAHTKELIEGEVREMIEKAYARAQEILVEKRDEWETLSQGLLEYETLTGAEITDLLKGKKPVRDTSVPPKSDDKAPPSGAVPVIEDEDEAPGGLTPKPGGA
jgi:cell division protease FtsH